MVRAPASTVCKLGEEDYEVLSKMHHLILRKKKSASSLFHALIKWRLGTFETIAGKPTKMQNLYLHKSIIEYEFTNGKRFCSFGPSHILSHLKKKKTSWRVVWKKIIFSAIYVPMGKMYVLPKAF